MMFLLKVELLPRYDQPPLLKIQLLWWVKIVMFCYQLFKYIFKDADNQIEINECGPSDNSCLPSKTLFQSLSRKEKQFQICHLANNAGLKVSEYKKLLKDNNSI